VGKAWEAIIYRMIQAGQCSRPATTDRLKKRKYAGSIVLEPDPKSYTTPIEVFDIKGLYPTMMILYNLSLKLFAAVVAELIQRPEYHRRLWIALMIVCKRK
jgi:DNA polymerase elongation subunit (family B)